MVSIKFLPLLGALLLATGDGHAALSGQVVDPGGQPLAKVSVVTDVAGVGTQTDDSGMYTIENPTDVTRITFSSVGFQSRQFKLLDLPFEVVLEPMYIRGSDIVVRADRSGAAIACDDYSRRDIDRDYTVAEFPLLLSGTPNLYSFSDAGSALGYSYMKIRGFDDKRVTTYINGVPLNDPEDQATYFVDLPDFAANVTDIQIQRGVGNSLYGDASFGGTVNIATSALSQSRRTAATAGYGQYTSDGSRVGDIYRQCIEYASGLVDGRWQYNGRFSRDKTSGYRHDSWYQGWAYYFALARLDPSMTTELYVYGGPMQMHLAYDGATRAQIAKDRLANPYHTYANETDNFNQPHYHLHNVYRLSERATLSNTLYYIRGKGYYEQYKSGREYAEYNIDTSLTGGVTKGDLVRQKWVYKNQVGWNPRLDIKHARGEHSLGASFYYFNSDHWGQVVWAQNVTGPLDPRHKYYQYYGDKRVASLYAQESYGLTDRLNLVATAQLRYQRYKFDQDRMGAFRGYHYNVDWLFFSPRLALNWRVDDRLSLQGFAAISSRTPTDADIYDANNPYILPSLRIRSMTTSLSGDTTYVFGDPTADAERVYDIEAGGQYRTDKYACGVNLFWMDFRNEIIPEGGLNENTGLPITINADRSVHAGVELTAAFRPSERLRVEGNYAYNNNWVKKYAGEIDVYDANWDWSRKQKVNYAGKVIAGFPAHLANLLIEAQYDRARATLRFQYAGKQYAELFNVDSLAIDPHVTASVSAEYLLPRVVEGGDVTLQFRIDNLFDTKYESSGYGWTYGLTDVSGNNVTLIHEGEYFVDAERSFYTQVKLELF